MTVKTSRPMAGLLLVVVGLAGVWLFRTKIDHRATPAMTSGVIVEDGRACITRRADDATRGRRDCFSGLDRASFDKMQATLRRGMTVEIEATGGAVAKRVVVDGQLRYDEPDDDRWLRRAIYAFFAVVILFGGFVLVRYRRELGARRA